MVTDGQCSDSCPGLDEISSQLRGSADQPGSQVWSIGVGNKIDENELKLISGNEDRVLNIDNYKKIGELKEVSWSLLLSLSLSCVVSVKIIGKRPFNVEFCYSLQC